MIFSKGDLRLALTEFPRPKLYLAAILNQQSHSMHPVRPGHTPAGRQGRAVIGVTLFGGML